MVASLWAANPAQAQKTIDDDNLISNGGFDSGSSDWSNDGGGAYFYYATSVDVNILSFGWTGGDSFWQNTGASIQSDLDYVLTIKAAVGQAPLTGVGVSFQDVTAGWTTLTNGNFTFPDQTLTWRTFSLYISSNTISGAVGDTIGVGGNLVENPNTQYGWLWVDWIQLAPALPYFTSQPESVTNYAGYPSVLSIPPAIGAVTNDSGFGSVILYQWYFGGNPIANATNTAYTIPVSNATNEGNYYVVATGPYGSTQSSPATLTVLPEPELTEMLYTAPASTSLTIRDNYTGGTGCEFEVGSSNVIVSHLGYYNANNSGLNVDHYVGVYGSGSGTPLLGQVIVPAGSSAYYTNSFYWVPLNPPLLLASNTSYYVAAMPYNGDGDEWGDSFAATFNSWFVGSQAASCMSAYGPGETNWPVPYFSAFGSGTTYCVENLGYIQTGSALVGVQETNVVISAGETLTVNGFASGQAPIFYQWYLAPGAPVSGQTNATLLIPNAPTGDSGTYYLTASNALGGAQSSNVVVLITAIPVGISQQPADTTVFQNYTATFSMTATGTPPISYQWSSNGVAIAGATASTYSLVASLANNGEVFSCLASNYISSVPYTANSSNATLTVTPNLAQPQEFLHGFNSTLDNNPYGGQQGGQFVVGNNPVLVTHLGFYAWPGNSTTNGSTITCTLSTDHHVGIYNADGSDLLGSVDVPAGSNPVTNGYMWQPLDPPLILSNNTQYLLEAETLSSGDPWGDTYHISDLNPYFATSCDAIYGGSGWGQTPYLGGGYSGQMYSAPNMAILALPTPSAYVVPDAVTNYAGLDAGLDAVVAGQAPVTLQWYQEPGTELVGQTNLLLNFPSLALSNAGSYYVIATNATLNTGARSADGVVTVLPDVGPSITQGIQSTNAFIDQIVQFATAESGTPPFTYQWTFDGNALAGATNSVLTLTEVSAASAGNYQLWVSNHYGWTNSSVASLQVITPAWGGYASGVMSEGTNLLAYYRFSDISNFVNNGEITARNQGSLGAACDGTYEGGCGMVVGPNILDLDEPTNLAVSMDGFTADVLVPALDNIVVSNFTIAAWVDDVNNPQGANDAIFFHRQSSLFGLSVNPDANTGADQIRVTWGGVYPDSDLDLATNQWCFVAAVFSPTNIAVYLQTNIAVYPQNGTGWQTTNIAGTYAPVSFSGDSYIGWDTAGGQGGRRWSGWLDEVMIFNEALSPTAINALYLGVPASATLTIVPSGAKLVVGWPGGTLQEAPTVTGPWTSTLDATNGSYTLTPSAAMKFYRVQLQKK
jgi:hypothetical protein